MGIIENLERTMKRWKKVIKNKGTFDQHAAAKASFEVA